MALVPRYRSFGFVIMEGPKSLTDWGVKFFRSNGSNGSGKRLKTLASQYRPDVILINEHPNNRRRRSQRVRVFFNEVKTLSTKFGIKIREIGNHQIRSVFSRYGDTKQELALGTIQQLPQLSRWYPRHRQVGSSEDHRMPVFDAAQVALTYYASVGE